MEKILIIEDSQMQIAQLKSILDADYDIAFTSTAKEGFDYAVSGEYSLILLDVVLPGMDGFTLLKMLQEEAITQGVPVIMITSLSDIESEQRGLTLGAVDYITKPFHPLIVKARVNTHIKLYQYRRQAEFQSMTDQLTGIPNRRRHDRYSLMKWNEAARLHVPISICMFDIDNFKAYNDTFGHPAGDKVISMVAKTLTVFLRRTTDFVARYGGEEFVAIILGGDARATFEYLKKIRRGIEQLHIPHAPEVCEWVTISVGGTTVNPRKGEDYDTYLKIADNMLYDAKRLGRNRVVWCSSDKEQWCERPVKE